MIVDQESDLYSRMYSIVLYSIMGMVGLRNVGYYVFILRVDPLNERAWLIKVHSFELAYAEYNLVGYNPW